ncbi:MAG: hypothetical protein JWL76_313 [Thermoleophilia bacterium]|nr:hypothetical protein [Thermoleophilia bacterium]
MRVLPHLPRATALLVAVAALAIPATAAAHSAGLGIGDSPVDEAAAASQTGELSEALASLPRETAQGACLSTEHVEGLGDACRTDEGEFRIALANGLTVTTHGTDAPRATDSRAAAAPHLPDSQTALNGATVADVECTSAPGDRRVELIYARPSDKPDRSAALAPSMRDALYKASAFVDAEAQAIDDTQGRRVRVACSGGVPLIHTAVVRASGTAGGDYSDIVDDLVAQGFPAPAWNSTSTRRFMVFYDDDSANGAAGIGGMWLDDVPGPDNLNNLGGRYAVEFDWAASHLPHWDVFLHEMSHNMGAVADGAPDSSQAGHCIDGLDVMCYADGGSGGAYTTSSCAVERYDCGSDSYFNPTPAPGSWLATHWNLASASNQWLVPRDLGWDDGGTPDATPPTLPGTPTPSAITTSAITVSWAASTDLRSSVRYRVLVDRFVSGAWQLDSTWTPITQPTLTVTSLTSAATYRFRVSAYDQAGNFTTEVAAQATTVAGPPIAPASIGLTIVDEDSLSVAWPAASAPAGVRGYEVERQRGADAWVRIGEFTTVATQVDGLDSGANYRARVRTVSNDGVASGWRTSLYTTMPGQLAGGGEDGTPLDTPEVTVTAASPTRAVASWTASPGAGSWSVALTDARSNTRSSTVTTTSLTLTGLVPGATYSLAVVASTEDAATLSEAGIASFRMPRDITAPGTSRFAAPRFSGTTMKVAWKAATDNAGVAKYQLQRRIGIRWVAVPVRAGATSASVAGVRRGSITVLRVRAIDIGGNAGRWSTTAFRRR